MKNKLKVLLPLLFVIALLAVMSFAVNAEECEHSITHVEAVEPECHTEGNLEYWYCTICNEWGIDEDLNRLMGYEPWRPALNLPADHYEAKDSTCSEFGNIEYWHCEECDQYWTDEALTQLTNRKNVLIAALDHDFVYVDAVEPECHYTGNIAYKYCYVCDTHWTMDGMLTNRKSVILPEKGSDQVVHVEAKEPTCTEDGNIEYWHCGECDQYLLDYVGLRPEIIIPALGHDYVAGVCTRCGECEHENFIHWDAIEPACHYSGNLDYFECLDCGHVWTDVPHVGIFDPYIPELGGEVEHVAAVAPTCETEGNVEYWHCAECDKYWVDEALTQLINRLNTFLGVLDHNKVHVDGVEPGCHYSGNWGYFECLDCGRMWAGEGHIGIFDPYIPELGGEVEHVEAVPPTEYSDGNLEYWYCAECDQYWLDEARTLLANRLSVMLPKLGHDDPFLPVEPEKWYTKAVDYCQKNGYMKGVSDESFGYKQTVTRAMFTTILAKIDGSDLTAYEGKSSFSDVKTDGWYTAAIEWAYQNGYAAGLGDGIFGYKENVTREQLVTFFYTYSAKNGVDVSGRADLAKYSDCDKIHDWARDAMSWAVNVGLVTGTSETTLSPRSFATRAELAVIVMNYVENIRCEIGDNYWIKYGLSVSARITGDLMPTFGPTSSLGLTVTLTSDVYEISELPEIEVSARVNGHSGSLELENNTDTLVYKLPVKIIEPGVTDFGSIYSELTNIAKSNSGDAKITVILKIGDEYEWFKITPEISVTH